MNFELLETPCYILHRDILEEGVFLLKNSLKEKWNNSIVGYSFKTNSLPWLVSYMKQVGFYAEVVSGDEYRLAEKMGFDQIIYNGPVKEKETFFDALQKGYIINLDAVRELDWLEEAKYKNLISEKTRIGLRVNFDLESLVPGETSAGEDGSRFGFSVESGAFETALARFKALDIKLNGLHLHASSKTRSLEIYRALAKEACILKEKYGLEPDYVDVGGGYFGGMKNRPEFPDYIEVIKKELLTGFDRQKTTLIMEPGTSLVSAPFEYITSVTDVKDTYAGRIVVTDGSRSDIDPLHTKSSYFHMEHYKKETQPHNKQVICGYTCMENDRLFTLKDGKELSPGDYISYQKVGGYTLCLTPLFIRYFPAVYLKNGDKTEKIRAHWGADEYIQKNRI